MPQLNPFLYGRPVPPSRFVGRSDAVRTVFSRLNNRESTAIVGEPHIGKSSILSYVADEAIRAAWLRDRSAQFVFTAIDCHMIPRQFSPADFWSHTLADVPQVVGHDGVARQWHATAAGQFGSFAVKRLFDGLSAAGWCVALVIDEFDVLVNHPLFDAEFFGALRSLAIGTSALAVITASRVPVAEMNRRSLDLNPHGSPFFNNFAEVRLLPLAPAECRTLIGAALAHTGVTFDDTDFELIYALSGRHPYLVQIAASALFDVVVDGHTGAGREHAASTLFHDRAAAHFDDVWRHLLPTQQAVLLVVALQELKRRLGGEAPQGGEIGDLRWCEATLRHLHEAGMVDRTERDGAAGGGPAGASWQVASRGFVWWVLDNVVTRTRDTIMLESRLREYESRGILSERGTEEVRSLAASIEPATLKGAEAVSRLLLGGGAAAPARARAPRRAASRDFDIFFSYNRDDRDAVLDIADRLHGQGMLAWVDERELRPGFPWQQALETQIRTLGAAAVFVGSKGIGPWQNVEQEALLRQFVSRKCPVIPVVLPGCGHTPPLPVFLEGMHWIDCRDPSVDPIERLIYGITGGRAPAAPASRRRPAADRAAKRRRPR